MLLQQAPPIVGASGGGRSAALLKTLHLAGTRKLRARFVRPFRVMEHVGRTAYRLDLRGRFKDIHIVFHVSQLKKHIPGGSSANPPEPI